MTGEVENMQSQVEVLNTLIAQQGITQTELARRLGLTPQRISAALQGKSPMQDGTYREWLAALGYVPRYGAVQLGGDLDAAARTVGLVRNSK